MTTMPRYGTLNLDYVSTWFSEADDGRPMWALNLMKYRPVADYQDGRESSITGWEADDLYKPEEPLRRIGAEIALIARVAHQLVGDDTRWDRVAIARYPRRAAMAEMNAMPEFQELHAHKDAGMEFTIVTATFPRLDSAPAALGSGDALGPGDALLLQLVADPDAPDVAGDIGAAVGRFDVEGVIIGDDRRWAEARWHVVSATDAAELAARENRRDPSSYVLLLEPDLFAMADLLTSEQAVS